MNYKKLDTSLVCIRLEKSIIQELDKLADKYKSLNKREFSRTELISKAVKQLINNERNKR